MMLRRHSLLGSSVAVDTILVTMTPTAGFTVGFNLTFTGSVSIDFKDGSGPESFTSGVEKTHIYAIAGTYVAEITGDITNITKFIADNSQISTITNLKTGLLTEFNISSNSYAGSLDMSNAPVSGIFNISANSALTEVIFSSTGNGVVTNFNSSITGLTYLDLSNVNISTTFNSLTCPDLAYITFATSGNSIVSDFRVSTCTSLTELDLSNVPLSGTFYTYQSAIASIILASSGNGNITNWRSYNQGLSTINFGNLSINYNIGAMQFQNNALTAAEINKILVDIDAISTGPHTGTIQLDGTNAAPDGTSGGYDGLTAKANIIAKGFTVTTN